MGLDVQEIWRTQYFHYLLKRLRTAILPERVPLNVVIGRARGLVAHSNLKEQHRSRNWKYINVTHTFDEMGGFIQFAAVDSAMKIELGNNQIKMRSNQY